MIRAQRRAHRRIWMVLLPLLLAAVGYSILVPYQAPTETRPPELGR